MFPCVEGRTVDGNRHDFGQDEAIGTDEGRYTVEGIQLEVLGLGIWWPSFHKLNVEIIGFGNSKQNCGSGIAL